MIRLIPFLLGCACVAAFAPVGFFPLALVGLAGLIHLWSVAPPRRCFVAGFWFGLGFFGAGVSWIYVSLHDIGGMPAPVAGLATLIFCAFLALLPAAAGWLQARIPAGPALRACLLIPASLTLMEWIRSWILSGFPWISFGYATVGWPLQGYGPLCGVFGLSLLTISLAGMLWLAVMRRRRIVWASAIVALFVVGEGLRHVEWTSPQGAPISVALLQGNIEQSLKFDPQRYVRTLETYAELAEATRAKLIVFPETAVPRFLDTVDLRYLAHLESIARRNDGDLILGVPTRQPPAQYYNTAITLGTSRPQSYHKVHLVPFGEFVPPGLGWTLRLVNIPMSDFSRGTLEQAVLEVAGQRVGLNICYEDAFGDAIARQLPDATLLVNISNVAWFGDSLAPAQHLQIARLRAIETGRMYVTATNTGITAAIDRDGRVVATLPQFAEGKLETTAQGYVGATPYVRWRDWPAVLLALGVLVVLTLVARRNLSR
ncbi:MAG TPA: apolipoprotein N-acyltransferase [Burkholderiales bacterium]|nr:apolipoprotein N-acyltransferase [Burkholderiales bacterium]